MRGLATPARRWYDPTMGMGRMWRWGLASALVAALAASCGPASKKSPFHDESKDAAELSAVHLRDGFDGASVVDLLGPQEKGAVERSGMSFGADPDGPPGAPPRRNVSADDDEPKTGFGRAMDTAGKVGVTLLGVGVSVGAVVAPFFLF